MANYIDHDIEMDISFLLGKFINKFKIIFRLLILNYTILCNHWYMVHIRKNGPHTPLMNGMWTVWYVPGPETQ